MRVILVTLIFLIALLSTTAGILLLFFPAEESLAYTTQHELMPFRDSFLAGTVLLIVTSSSSLIAFYGLLAKPLNQYRWSTICGVLLATGAILQILLQQTVQWTQIAMAGVGILIILIVYQLKGKWAV